jgi:hypothetical protein
MQLIPMDARYPDLKAEIETLFSDVQLESVACEACGDYHPPEIHLRPMTPFDPSEPEEA